MGLKDKIRNKLGNGKKEEQQVNYPPEMLEEACGHALALVAFPQDVIFGVAGQYIHLLKKAFLRNKALKRQLSRVQLTEAGSGWTIVSPDKVDLVEESGKADGRKKEDEKKGKKHC